MLRKKKKAKERKDKLTSKAVQYVKKMQEVFGYFCYNGYICDIEGPHINATMVGNKNKRIATLGCDVIINTRRDLKSFKDEINKTFDWDFDFYTEDELLKLMKENGEHEKLTDRDADWYIIREDSNNFIAAIKESDGDIWFRFGSGCSGSSSSWAFKFEEGPHTAVIYILNMIKYIKDRDEKK
jgi:uncharacterized protein (DUF779 family)